MPEYTIDGGFECDYDSKIRISAAIKQWIESGGVWKVNDIKFTEPKTAIDILMNLESIHGKSRHIAIEAKERRNLKPEEHNAEFCNIEKEFDPFRESGYTILWAVIYKDAFNDFYPICVWDYDNATKPYLGEFPIKRHTVIKGEEKVLQKRWGLLWNETVIRTIFPKKPGGKEWKKYMDTYDEGGDYN